MSFTNYPFKTTIGNINFILQEDGSVATDYLSLEDKGMADLHRHTIASLLQRVKELEDEKSENKFLATEHFCGEMGEIGFVGIRDYAALKQYAFDWTRLHDAFMAISRVNAQGSKSNEGYMYLKFDADNYWEKDQEKYYAYIWIELGGYQIGDWRRHQTFGPFKDVKSAWEKAVEVVKEAYHIVKKEMEEDGKEIFNMPLILREDQ